MDAVGRHPEACCRVCWDESTKDWSRIEKVFGRPFIVCNKCGNKRCPMATDHKLACNDSNEPGQRGSAYE